MTNRVRGYTLIELAVVVLLVGLMLLLAVPRVRDTLLNDSLKAAARQFVGNSRELGNTAVREQTDFVLQLDLNQGFYWSYPADATPEKRAEVKKWAARLPADVRIVAVRHAGEAKKGEGEAFIRFSRQGYVTPTVILLAKEDRALTLVFQPFFREVTVYEKEVDFVFNEEDSGAMP